MKEIIVFALDDNEIKELTGSKDEEELSIWRSYIPSPPRITGELIRCKDCKSYQPRYIEGNEMLGSCQNLNSNFVTGMGYCYWAERKEE